MKASRETIIQAIRWCSVILVAALVLPQSAIGQSPREIQVRWGINTPYFPGNTPIDIGIKSGIFKKHGLEVEPVQTQSPMPPLLSGSTDIAVTGAPPWLSAIAQGQKPVALAIVLPRNSQALMVTPASPIAQLAGQWPGAVLALKGKEVGVSVAGAQVDLTTRYLLMKAGLQPGKDVTIVALGGGTPQSAALEQNRVDAIMSYVPFVQVLEANHRATAIFDFTSPPANLPPQLNQPYMLAVANAKFLQAHPDVARRVHAALQDVWAWIMAPANTAALREELSSGFGTGVSAETVDGIIDQLRRGGDRVTYTCSDFASAVDLMRSLGKLDKEPACSDYVIAQ